MSHSFGIPVIGITGGIGSGKSSVTREAVRDRPWFVLDADRIGHEVLKQPSVKDQLKQAFGPTIFSSDNNIDRSALAAMVFGTENNKNRHQLESIVHPEIRRECERRIQDAVVEQQVQAVLLDAAVLHEAGWAEVCDAIVFIETDERDRIDRVRNSRGWSEDELKKREASQLSLAEKKAKADFRISNRGELSLAAHELRTIVDHLVREKSDQV